MKTQFFKSVIGLGMLLIFFSCSVAPQPIEYGKDQCSFCKMNIVDKTHAAQFVTKKGKQYKFDAIECMVNSVIEINNTQIEILLVANYGKPGEMINAKTASYLISPEIKSPMGANLSAVSTLDEANKLKESYTGNIYTWETLLQKFSN
jgi:copper chaperone NosL